MDNKVKFLFQVEVTAEFEVKGIKDGVAIVDVSRSFEDDIFDAEFETLDINVNNKRALTNESVDLSNLSKKERVMLKRLIKEYV